MIDPIELIQWFEKCSPKNENAGKWWPIFTLFFNSSIIYAFRCLFLRISLKYRMYVCEQRQNLIDKKKIYFFLIKMTHSTTFGANIGFLGYGLVGTNFFLINQCHLEPNMGYMKNTYLFKIKPGTLHFAYKFKSFFSIDLPFEGHHICPFHGVPCKFGKDIFNIKNALLIFQKDTFLRREPIQSQSSVLLYYW